mgnify:CR=1 FL=1
MFDCHIHSDFSTDSKMSAVSACETAILKGLKGIAFTDHLDYDFPDYEDEFMVDFHEYCRFMDSLKADYELKLKVLKGVEVGIQPHVIEETNKTLLQHEFDYVIGSIHIIARRNPYVAGYYDGISKKEAYVRYLQEIMFMIENFKDFDVIGHLDYIIRCADYDDRTLRYADCSDIIDSIFKLIIPVGKGIEINTGSYRPRNEDTPVPCYDFDILKRYRELGGEIVCVGSDAHFAEHVGYRFDYFHEILLNCGFRHTVHFEKRKPIFTPI